MRPQNHASRFAGIPKTNLQGSGPKARKTLQIQRPLARQKPALDQWPSHCSRSTNYCARLSRGWSGGSRRSRRCHPSGARPRSQAKENNTTRPRGTRQSPLRALPEGVRSVGGEICREPFHLKEIPDRLCKPGQPEPLGAIPAMPIQIIAVEVIRWGDWWDDRWAVAIRYSNGRRQVFQLGNRLQAEKEVDRLRREAIRPVSDS